MKRGTILLAVLGLALSLGSGSVLAQIPSADLNCDECLDRSDLNILLGYRNQAADACPDSPCGGVCDLDDDGMITVLDARILVVNCDQPRCTPCPPPCTDGDGDDFNVEGGDCGPVDCDDNNPDDYPGAPEVCDGVDNDCDGLVDEDCVTECENVVQFGISPVDFCLDGCAPFEPGDPYFYGCINTVVDQGDPGDPDDDRYAIPQCGADDSLPSGVGCYCFESLHEDLNYCFVPEPAEPAAK